MGYMLNDVEKCLLLVVLLDTRFITKRMSTKELEHQRQLYLLIKKLAVGCGGNVLVYASGSMITGLYTGFWKSVALILVVARWLPLHLGVTSSNQNHNQNDMTGGKMISFHKSHHCNLEVTFYEKSRVFPFISQLSKLSHMTNPISSRGYKKKHREIEKTLS